MSEYLDCEIVTTTGGATAIRDRISCEVMHPVIGPLLEAQSLYVEPSQLVTRLQQSHEQDLVVLDVGLGAGSNALAALKVAQALFAEDSLGRKLSVISLDRCASAFELARSEACAEAFGYNPELAELASQLSENAQAKCAWASWRYIEGDLMHTLFELASGSVDVVYWDPWSPKGRPRLWTQAVFKQVRDLCRSGATLHTYCSATAVRSAMLLGGFCVGEGPITQALRATTIAAADLDSLQQPLTRRFVERLSRSSAPFPEDASENALAEVAALQQFRS